MTTNSTTTNVHIDGNSADYGGGIDLAGSGETGPTLTLTDCFVTNNRAGYDEEEGPLGGGAYLEGPFRLESVNTDWGSGSDDNTHKDIVIGGLGLHAGSYNVPPDTTSFTCDSDSMSCSLRE